MKKYILSMILAVMAISGCADNSKSRSEESGVRNENTPATDISPSSLPTPPSSDMAPDFTLNDLSGKPLTLSSLRGKYVILDFWGSWCGWCIKGMPKMKEYYQKYAGKFEILGIDCNDPEEKWKAAVEKYELPWLHVYNTRDSKVLEQYNIEGFPTKIIVGPDGKIVKTIIGEDPAFYAFLDELFKN
jgi:thiol-disulfide isomerase/thioredoxin